MRYKAKEDGFIDRYIRAGEEFEYDGPAPSWGEPLEKKAPAKANKASAKKEPEVLEPDVFKEG